MADQSSVNGQGTARVPGSSSAEFEGVAEFVDDLASLAELQAKLAAADFRDAVRKSAVPIVLTVVGVTMLAASVLVALLAHGWLLASALNIHQGWAMIVTAGAAIVLAVFVAGWGGMRLTHSFDSFRRSRSNFGSTWRGSGPSLSPAVSAPRTREIVYEFFMRFATRISPVFPIGPLRNYLNTATRPAACSLCDTITTHMPIGLIPGS